MRRHIPTVDLVLPQEVRVQQPVPSGQQVELFEVLIDQVGVEVWLRFRFLAPAIGKGEDNLAFVDVQNDFAHLCDAVVLPYLAEFDLNPDVVVVALLDRPIAFGVADPEATQFIEAFRIESGICALDGEW